MLRREQDDQLQVLVPRDEIDVRRPRAIDAALVGDETDAFTAQRLRDIGNEYVDTGQDRRVGGRWRLRSRRPGADNGQNERQDDGFHRL